MLARISLIALVASCGLVADNARSAEPEKLAAVATIKHNGPVDFEKEVLPLLKRNCVACHNQTKAENKLIVENPQAMLRGGDNGPAVVAGKGETSLLLVRARGGGDGIMPPDDNKVGAKALTAEELGLLKLWIDQGAKGAVATVEKIQWQPLPPTVNPIYAIALTPDAQYAAANRANQVFLYQLTTGREIGRLTDPELLKSGIYKLPGVADLDLVQSLAFSPDGKLLATGGFQAVKLWQRPENVTEGRYTAPAPVRAAAVSADGKHVALGCDNGAVLLYTVGKAEPRAKLDGHTGAVSSLQFSNDGNQLVSGSADKSIRGWSTADGKQLWQIDAPQPVVGVAWLAADLIASAGGEKEVRLWNPTAAEKKELGTLAGHSTPVTALAALAGQKDKLYSGDEKGDVIAWDANGKKQIKKYEHKERIVALAVRADAQRLASLAEKSARVWNTADGKQLAEVRGEPRQLREIAARDRALAIAKGLVTTEKTALTDAEKGASAEKEAINKATEAAKKVDKEFVDKTEAAKKAADAQAAADKALKDAQAAQKQAEAEAPKADEALKKAEAAQAAAKKNADEKAAAAKKEAAEKKEAADKAVAEAADKAKTELAEADKKLKEAKEASEKAKKALADANGKVKPAEDALKKATDASTAAEMARKSAETSKAAGARAIVLAQEGLKQAEAEVKAAQQSQQAAEAAVKTREAELNAAKEAATKAEQPYTAIAFSPDNAELALADKSGLVSTWSAEDGLPLETFSGPKAAGVAVSFLGPKQLLAAAAEPTVVVWNTLPAQWQLVRKIGVGKIADRVMAIDFSPDGKLLATGSGIPSRGGELKLWNVADGALVREVKDAHSDTVLAVRFSPDGKQLASGSADKFMKVHQVADGKLVRSYEGHTHHVQGVAWSPDGKLLASAGADNVVKLWEVASGEQKKTMTGFGKEVTSVVFLADGSQLLAGSGDNSVRIKRASDGGDVRTLGGSTDFVFAVAASADGKTAVAGGQDSNLRVWRCENGNLLRTLAPPPPPESPAQASR